MKSLPRILKSFPALAAISTALCVIPYFLFDIFYLYGDDYLINYIANGSFGTRYSSHLIFIRYPLSLLLGGLFRVLPSVNWYAVLLTAVFALSFAIFHRAVLRAGGSPFGLLFSLLANAAAVPLFLTYTAAAFLAAAAGLALLCGQLREGKSGLRLLPGVLLMTLSYMLRNDCLLPVCALALPACLGLLPRGSLRASLAALRSLLLRALLPAAALLLLLAGIELLHKGSMRASAWQDYARYNAARSSYLDQPEVPYSAFPGEFAEAGLSEEGWLLLHRWTFCEKDSFPAEKFERFADIARRAFTRRYRLKALIDTFSGAPNVLLLVIPGLMLLLFLLEGPAGARPRGAGRLRAVFPLLTYLALIVLFAFLAAIRLRFVLRVGVPLAICAVLWECLSAAEPEDGLSVRKPCLTGAGLAAGRLIPDTGSAAEAGGRSSSGRTRARIALCFTAAAALLALLFFFRSYQDAVAPLRNRQTAANVARLREEMEKHPQRVYVVESPIYVHLFAWGHTVGEIAPTELLTRVIRPGSWDNFSPRYYDIASRCGVRDPDNLLSSLIDAENIYFVSEDVNYVRNFLNTVKDRPVVVRNRKKRGVATIVRFAYAD